MTAGSFRAGGLFIFVKEMINIAIKLATSITYTADGSQTNFSVPFDYLRPSFVHVAVDDAEVSEGFTISNRMVMFDAAPAKDAVVHIYRSTPTTRLVSWADASILKAIDMTIAEVQQLHILEESSDWSKTNSIVLDEESGVWQGRKCRVSNVANPIEAQDVVTKDYLEDIEESFVQRMNTIKTATVQFAGAAETAKNDASLYATNAKNSAGEAKTYMDNAKRYSENVNVFTPSVSSDGVLSWTNKAGLPNPASVNIKGAKGDQGLQGATGAAASIKIGSVTTGEPGTNASVTNSGTASNVVLNFTLPRGNNGKDGSVTVDAELSDTSTNPVQNKAIYKALLGKVGTDIFTGFALIGATATIAWRQGTQMLGAINATNYSGTARTALRDGEGNVITETYAKKDTVNKWAAQQNFQQVLLTKEKYFSHAEKGTSGTPAVSVIEYIPTGAFTLDLSKIVASLEVNNATVLTAYIKSSADYPLTITNAGTLKYIGSASDVAITSAGLLLNILIKKENTGNVISIVQTSKLS